MKRLKRPLSRTAVDQAGDVLRSHQARTRTADFQELGEAYDILTRFRQEWAEPPYPLTTANMGLRSMVKIAVGNAHVSQRLKRANRIVDKLVRYPTTRLSQMDDIGGCRVVVTDLKQLDRLRDHLLGRWADVARVRHDYIARPKPPGYRAVHLVVWSHDHRVEIQLRTARQHQWAVAVESAEAALGVRLRDGEGRPEVLALLEAIAEAAACADRGQSVPSALRERLRALLNLRGRKG